MAWRGSFQTEDLTGERGALALDLLRDGQPVVVADVVLSLAAPGLVTATARSAWSSASRITSASALNDLARAGSVLAAANQASAPFRQLTNARETELAVVVDYSTGSTLVARSRNGSATWADGRPLSAES